MHNNQENLGKSNMQIINIVAHEPGLLAEILDNGDWVNCCHANKTP